MLSVDAATETESPESLQKWDDKHVRLLIESYGQFKHLLKKGKTTKKDVFQKIYNHFNETSEYKVTVDQCIRKWDKLVAKFKQVEDNNKQTGKARQTCKFYDSLQECIGESRKVNPSYTFDVARVASSSFARAASSSPSQSDSTAECDDNGDELEDDEGGNSLEGAKNGNKRVRKRKSHSSAAEMLTFLQSYSEKREKVEEEKISLLKEMQKEKKELFGQLLDVLKKK